MIIILKKVTKTLVFNKNDLDIIHELWKSWFYKLLPASKIWNTFRNFDKILFCSLYIKKFLLNETVNSSLAKYNKKKTKKGSKESVAKGIENLSEK